MTLPAGTSPMAVPPSSPAAGASAADDVGCGRSRLSAPRYVSYAGAALWLAAVQLALLPRWLSAQQFGTVVLGISATQGVLQLGDLGFSRLCIDARRSPHHQAGLRAEGRSLILLTTAAVTAAAALAWMLLPEQRPVCLAIALGALAAAAVSTSRFRAAALEVAGDEQRAAMQNFLWSNAPKIGLVVALPAFRSATAILATSVVAGIALCRPAAVRLRLALAAARRYRQWAYPFISIAAGFVLTWSDTYFLSAHLGLGAAGAYEAVFRVLGVCSYGFLPWASVITSRVSVDEASPVRRPLAAALATTVVAMAGGAVLLSSAGTRLFPRLDLPLDAIPPLVLFYLATTVAACVGSALYVRGRLDAVTRASVVGAVTCVAGHAFFTLRGDARTAAWVAAGAMGVNAGLLAVAYRRKAGKGLLRSRARR